MDPDSRSKIFGAAGVILVATWCVYRNSLSGAFIFDDTPTILENPTLTHLWPLSGPLSPPQGGMTVSGRPILNLSLALNYVLGGTAVWSYHVVNLAIHMLASLALFGIVRRTFQGAVLREKFAADALPLALLAAVFWAVHPLLTESVTYVVQRAESLAGLFYFLTLYCLVRGTSSSRAAGWHAISALACCMGMATKEIVVSAPLVVFLYDRAFVTGTFRDAWRQRSRFYLGLAASWLLVAYLMLGTGSRNGTAGLGLGVSSWAYSLTQCFAILRYLQLSLWPHPLIFDYGTDLVRSPAQVWPQALLLLMLLSATAYLLWRRPAWGFLGAWFFLILAPTSSVVPVTSQTIAEHRMYLPTAAVVVIVIIGVYLFAGRRGLLPAGIASAICLGGMTARRNIDYRNDLAIWQDTVAKLPLNARAHYNYGAALSPLGEPERELAQYREALRLKPNYAEAYYNMGNLALKQGRPAEAMSNYETAIRVRPGYAKAHYNLATLLSQQGYITEAANQLELAIQYNPADAEAHNNLGSIRYQQGRMEGAAAHLAEAARLRPTYAKTQYNLGTVFLEMGRKTEAAAHYEEALRLQPGYREAQNALTALRKQTVKQN